MTWYRYWAQNALQAGSPFHVKHEDAGASRPNSPASTAPSQGSNGGQSARSRPHAASGPAADAERVHDSWHTATRTGRTIVVANQKGGVGKTTTAVSVAAALARRNWRVLVVDLDPQGNATSGLGVSRDGLRTTVYDVLVNDTPAAEAVIATGVPGLFLLPSSIDLAGAEIELVSAFSREQKLARALMGLRNDYDVVFVDCPPSLGLVTVNALTAGDTVLVPIQCEYYALEGLGSLHANIDLIRRHLNPGLEVLGYVMTMHDGRTRLSEQVVEEVQRHFGDKVLTTRVPRSVRLAEAPSYGQPITVFDPGSRGAVAYFRVADEISQRLAAMAPRELDEGVVK